MSDEVLAADGRVIGARAQVTRQRLLESTAKLLAENGVLELKVVDITREVGTSPATFYQYFADVDAAILDLVKETTEHEGELLAHLKGGWADDDGRERATAFVEAYLQYWDEHSAVLRVRDLKAEEDDKRFRRARTRALLLLIDEMESMVRQGQAAKRLPPTLDPFATAAAMIAMVERLVAYQREIALRGAGRDELRDTLSHILYTTLTGRSA